MSQQASDAPLCSCKGIIGDVGLCDGACGGAHQYSAQADLASARAGQLSGPKVGSDVLRADLARAEAEVERLSNELKRRYWETHPETGTQSPGETS